MMLVSGCGCDGGAEQHRNWLRATVLGWIGRRRSARERQRTLATLSGFDDRILADVGVSRHELESEIEADGGRPAPALTPCGG